MESVASPSRMISFGGFAGVCAKRSVKKCCPDGGSQAMQRYRSIYGSSVSSRGTATSKRFNVDDDANGLPRSSSRRRSNRDYQPSTRQRQQTVVLHSIVIVQVLVPQAQTEHTLLQHDLKIMLNERRMATIFEASGGTLQGCRHTVNCTQQQCHAIPRHAAASTIGHNTLATMGWKSNQSCVQTAFMEWVPVCV